MTWGPLGPTPRMNRPPDIASRVIAVIAAHAGARAPIWMMAVPTLMREVRARIHAAGVTASEPHASEVHTESKPRFSASRMRSIGTAMSAGE